MGKKSFVSDDYDPIGQALAVDEAKAKAPRESVAPAPAPAQAPPPAVKQDRPRPERQTAVPPPRPEPVAKPVGGGGAENVVSLPTQPPPRPVRTGDDVEVSKRVKVSRDAFLDFEAMLSRIHQQTGTQIPYSVATRLSWDLMTRAEAQILDELRRHPVGSLPSTRDPVAFAAFQERLLKAAATAYRKLPKSVFEGLAASASDDREE